MQGCGWLAGGTVGQPEPQSALPLAASVASRYALGANGVGAARPGARGSWVPASRYALGAEGAGAARPGAYMCFRTRAPIRCSTPGQKRPVRGGKQARSYTR